MVESFFLSADVLKVFPVSFERAEKYDRVLSEENLVDWFRGVAAHSSDLSRNSRYSYVLTDEITSTFGNNSGIDQAFEFILGGYYVKVSDKGFARMLATNNDDADIYAVLQESEGTFRHLYNGEDINASEQFKAVKFVTCNVGEELQFTDPRLYKLHILTVKDGVFTIPPVSKRASFSADGGEID